MFNDGQASESLPQIGEPSTRPSSGSLPQQRDKPSPTVACTLCRQCKAKCITSEPSSSQCDRCRAVGCVCIRQPHQRGRKRTRGMDLPKATANHTSSSGSSTLPFDSQAISSAITSGNSTDYEEDRDVDSANASTSAAHALPFISGSGNGAFSLQNMLSPLSPQGSNPRRRLPGLGERTEDDAVSRGIVTLEMANIMFDYFMKTLNPIIMLFDPDLHSFDYIRKRSAFLLSTILSAAAKFMVPSLSPLLEELVAVKSVQAALSSRTSIETVQSWMMMYFWKAPRDKRAWTYVGLISRLSIEMGLDRTPWEGPSGENELRQRERRNRIRTWMLAYMMDRAMASTTGKDWCLRGLDPIIRDPRRFSDHPLRNHGDAVIAGFTELRRIASTAMDVLSPPSEKMASRIDIDRHLLTVNYDLDEWRRFWSEETAKHRSPPIYSAYLHLFECHIRLTLNSFAVDLTDVIDDVFTVQSDARYKARQHCYDLATECLNAIKEISNIDSAILHHAQDSISIMVAYAASFLRALVDNPTFTHDERIKAILLISETSQLFKMVSENTETTSALQAEFLQSLTTQPVPPIDLASEMDGSTMFNTGPDLNELLNSFEPDGDLDFSTFFEPLPDPAASMALLPYHLPQTNLATLGGTEWDQALAELLQLPR